MRNVLQTILGTCISINSSSPWLPVDKLNRCTALIEACLKKDNIQLNPPPPPPPLNLLPQYWLQSPSIDLYTDASGTLGYGAVLGPQWLFGPRDDEWRGQSITLLEFHPIVLAVSVWADSLSNKCISFHSDNRAVVDINSQTSKATKVMHLMRKLVLSCLRHNILFRAVHIHGINNNLAHSLSRLQVERFQALAPKACPFPVSIPSLPALPR